jgi:hypothetical protein
VKPPNFTRTSQPRASRTPEILKCTRVHGRNPAPSTLEQSISGCGSGVIFSRGRIVGLTPSPTRSRRAARYSSPSKPLRAWYAHQAIMSNCWDETNGHDAKVKTGGSRVAGVRGWKRCGRSHRHLRCHLPQRGRSRSTARSKPSTRLCP